MTHPEQLRNDARAVSEALRTYIEQVRKERGK